MKMMVRARDVAFVVAAGLILALLPSMTVAIGASLHASSPPDAAPGAAPGAATPVWTTESEHWYTLELDGAPVGWSHEAIDNDGARYRSVTNTTIRIKRSGTSIEVRMEEEYVESHAGALLKMRSLQDMAQQQVETVWTFHDDHVMSVSTQGGRTVETRHAVPEGAWLTPREVQRYWLARRDADAKSITYRTVVTDGGLTPVTITHELMREDEHEFEGRRVSATVWRSTNSVQPAVESVSTYARDGTLLVERTPLPLGALTARIATRADARKAGDVPPPELLVTSFVTVDRPIERARASTTSTLRLRTREGTMPALPIAGAQRVEPGPDDRTALLHIDTRTPVPASPEERDDPAYARPSAMANSDDPLIQAHVRRACAGVSADPMARAEAMRRYVHRHISRKHLDTAFATASETARMQTGDCSEHGVLLCAMLRADGIPARAATGLVYMDAFAGDRNIFGWHMWTQALIGGAWVDFDATLAERFDAVHVLTGTASLADGGSGAEMASVLMLLGNLEIEVVAVGHDPGDDTGDDAGPADRSER